MNNIKQITQIETNCYVNTQINNVEETAETVVNFLNQLRYSKEPKALYFNADNAYITVTKNICYVKQKMFYKVNIVGPKYEPYIEIILHKLSKKQNTTLEKVKIAIKKAKLFENKTENKTIAIFQNSEKTPSKFIESINFHLQTQNIEVKIKDKNNNIKTYLYPFNQNQITTVIDYVKEYGAGKTYNWLVKSNNFTKVQ